ncbi:MAG: hypothetical protein LWW77_06725 [Propionibacteriales bacterium]|nr:hypothetical protein [Propionibacteriales bacterium]
MADKRSEFDRLLADEFGVDDPTWGRVASFLSRVQTSAVTPSVESLEAAHVARVRAALSALGTLPRAQRRERRAAQIRRFVLAGVAGVFAVLTAGAGVAAAMGVDPIDALRHVQLGPVIFTPGTPDPTHPSTPDPSRRPDAPQTSAPGQNGTAGKADEDHGQADEDHGKADEDHGKADEDHGKADEDHGKASEHATQTAKPTDEKTNEGKSDDSHPTTKATEHKTDD